MGLVRCSTTGQADTSIDDQLVVLAAFAREHEMAHVDDVVLEGVSGSIPGNRSDIDGLVARKQQRDDFDVLLVLDTTRLTRGGAKHGAKIEYDLEAAGIQVVFVADNLPEGEFADIYKSMLYFSGKQQAKSIAMTSARGSMSSLQQGRSAHCKRTPYGIDRLYVSAEGTPSHIIRNLTDGTQVKLDPETKQVIGRFGRNEGRGVPRHYIKQKDERVVLVPGADDQLVVVRRIFEQHFVQGMGYFNIAKGLNDQGIPSPADHSWTGSQVRSILLNPIYVGLGIANRFTRAVYCVRAPVSPRPAIADSKLLASRKHLPTKVRPRKDWYERTEPELIDLLDEPIRELARRKQEQVLADQADGREPKFSRDRHSQSDFILKNLLTSRQGGFALTGRHTGRKTSRRRYYAVSKAYSTPTSDKVLRKMIPAEPVEQAVLGIVREILMHMPDGKRKIVDAVDCCRRSAKRDRGDLSKLQEQRATVQRKIEFIIDELDELGREAAKKKLDKLQAQLRALDEQIRQAEKSAPSSLDDPDAVAADLAAKLARLGETLDDLPVPALRRLLETLIESAVVDLQTREVELSLRLPSWAVENLDAMCLDSSFACKPVIEAHPECDLALVRTALVWSGGTFSGCKTAA